MAQENAHYKTSDTALASFLITQRYSLLSIDYTQPRFEWIFPISDEIQESANSYLIGSALVDPAVYSKIFRKANRVIRKQVQWEDD